MGMQSKYAASGSAKSASLEKYISLVNECRSRWYSPGTFQLDMLMLLMENELLRNGNCLLLDLCVGSWRAYCQDRGIRVELNALKSFEIRFLSEFRRLGSYDTMVLPFLFGTYLNEPGMYPLEAKKLMPAMFRQQPVESFRPDMMVQYLAWIDKGMEARGMRIQTESEEVLLEARKEAENIRAEAVREGERILTAARTESESVLAQAKENANTLSARILTQAREEARKQAEEAIAAAQVEINQMKRQPRYESYEADHGTLMTGLDGMRKGLLELNSQMRTLEERLTAANTQKAFYQLSELYDLMADVRDSLNRTRKETPALENMYCNMETFLQMITEYMAEYGIRTVETAPGAPFSGKHHQVSSGGAFDPNHARVQESLRCGFQWGDAVMKKEKVLLKREDV